MFRANENELAQLDHFGYGALFTVIGALFHYAWIGAAVAGGWALFKELYVDPFRNHDPWKNNLIDLGYWALGISAGLVASYIARRFLHC